MIKKFIKLIFVLSSITLVIACGVKGKLDTSQDIEKETYNR